MQRSRGFKSRTRSKLTKRERPGRSNPITRKIQQFNEGDLVHIIIDPSIQKGQTTLKIPWQNCKSRRQKRQSLHSCIKRWKQSKRVNCYC